LNLQADPALQISDAGSSMTTAQRSFREAWLTTKVKELRPQGEAPAPYFTITRTSNFR
jgi:hypothetical protein